MARIAPASAPTQERFFGLHFDLHPGASDTLLGSRVTEAMVRRIIRAARPDFIQYDCKGHVGYLGYPNSRVSAVAGGPGGAGIVNDSLAIYRKATRAAGVALLVHFSGVWDNVALKDHPEWAAQKPDGSPHENATSTFGPYVTERMIPQMKEVIDRYGVDGFWVDGDCWALQPDYCDAAKNLYRTATGHDEPPTKPGEPGWLAWMTIQRDQFFAYLKTYVEAVHAYRPSVRVASNWLYSPLSPEPVKFPMAFISGDYSHSDSVNSARFNGRQMAGVGLPWDLMAWAFSLGGSFGHLYKPLEQLQQEAAAVLALGGGFQMYFHPDRHGGFASQQIELMRGVADFCHARRDVCFQSQPVEQVGLLLDTTTLFTQSGGVYAPWGSEYHALQGVLHATLEAGHSAEIVADHQLPGQLDHWPVIVVPEWELLSPSLVTCLVGYARRGGSVWVIGGRACGLFREHLGVTFEGEASERSAFLQIERKPHGLEPFALPLKGVWQDVTVAKKRGGPRVVAWRTRWQEGEAERMPAVTVTPVGEGRIAACYGPLASAHFHMHPAPLRDFVGMVLGSLYRPRVTISGEGVRGLVDVAVRQKEGRLVVHLNNVSAMPTGGRYLHVDRVPATPPIAMRVRVDAKPRRVTLEPGGKRLKSTYRNGTLSLAVPPVHIHSAVVIE